MEIVVKKLKNLHNIKEKFLEKNLVPQISIDKKEERELLLNKIKQTKLTHRYEYEKFGVSDYMELLEYVLKQDDDWQLNKKTITEIFYHFKGRFSVSILKRKLFKYGIDYHFD